MRLAALTRWGLTGWRLLRQHGLVKPAVRLILSGHGFEGLTGRIMPVLVAAGTLFEVARLAVGPNFLLFDGLFSSKGWGRSWTSTLPGVFADGQERPVSPPHELATTSHCSLQTHLLVPEQLSCAFVSLNL